MPNAHVIGLGKSGIAAAQLLHRQGWQVIVSDRGHSAALQEIQQTLGAEGIQVKLGHTLEPDAHEIQRIVVSPGVPWDSPALLKARELGIETIGETELAWQTLQHLPWIGITGTNGKTTTTALIAAIFQTAGLQAPACGNIGHAVCDLALQTLSPPSSLFSSPSPNWIIAELSSYQIEASPTIAPKIAVWTTFTPDHLSRHYTLENYYNIKAHLLKQAQQQVMNGDDPYLRHIAEQWTDAYWTSVAGKTHLPGKPGRGAYIENGWVVFQDEAIVPVSDLRMVGAHNQQNLLMAVLVARLAGIEKAAITEAIRTFPGVPHRLEHICTWNGIDFINDSKATNYDAAQVGLSSVEAPVILIAGGDAKEGDDTGWIATIHAKAVKVLLIGDAAPKFAQRLQESGYTKTEIVKTMDRAVLRAAELGQAVSAKVVLLSPACASFDQYANFEQRGDHFRQLCQELLQ